MIIVTGMQRSGTSLVCQLLAALGVPFGDPDELIPGDRWNEAGYFEQKDVVDVNSRIITGLPRIAGRPRALLSKAAYLRMPEAAAMDARAGDLRQRIVDLGRRHADGAVKDPRFCLTLRFWLQWTAVHAVVVCLRRPDAVVASLGRRHRLPAWLGAKFFAWHVDALLAQLPRNTLFVDVDRVAGGDARALDELRLGLGLEAGRSSSDVLREVVRPGRLRAPGRRGSCPEVATRAWQDLLASAASARAPAAVRRH